MCTEDEQASKLRSRYQRNPLTHNKSTPYPLIEKIQIMKTSLTVLATLFFATLLFVQCKKKERIEHENRVFNCYFYTSNDSADVNLSLYIDDEYKGELPYVSGDPLLPGDPELANTLQLSINSGEYSISGKNEAGQSQSKSNVKLYCEEQSVEVDGNNGGTGGIHVRYDTANSFVIRLFF